MTGKAQPPTRRSRAEAQRETRDRLLSAASEVFTERGFGAASVEEIAAAAGFTRGAFYSNFPDKDAIFLALMDERLAHNVASVTAVMTRATPATLFDALRASEATGGPQSPWPVLEAEFRAHALRNEAARARLVEHDRAEVEALAQAVAAHFEALGLEPPGPVEDIALIIHLIDMGVGPARWIDPTGIREGFVFDALALLARAGEALARASAAEA
jgi:AcrR family transcriptional regulator